MPLRRKAVDSSAQPWEGADTLGNPSESATHLVDRESSVAPEVSTISNAFTPDVLERIFSAQTASISTLLSTLPSLLKQRLLLAVLCIRVLLLYLPSQNM